jgi:hypothetical protein
MSTHSSCVHYRADLKQKAEDMLQKKIDAVLRQSQLAEEAQQKASDDEEAISTVIDAALVDCDSGVGASGIDSATATWKEIGLVVLKAAARALVPAADRGRGHALPTNKQPLQKTVKPYLKKHIQAKLIEVAAARAARGYPMNK